MKSVTRLLLLALSLCGLPSLASAEPAPGVVIYQASISSVQTGGGKAVRTRERAFIVHSLPGVGVYETAFVQISYYTRGRQRLYSVSETQPIHINPVFGNRGVGYTALTYAHSPSPIDASILTEAFMAKGRNYLLLTGTSQIVAPRSLSGNYNSVSVAPDNQRYLVTAPVRMSYNYTQTRTSNNAGETLEQTVHRLVTYLQQHGYVLDPDSAP